MVAFVRDLNALVGPWCPGSRTLTILAAPLGARTAWLTPGPRSGAISTAVRYGGRDQEFSKLAGMLGFEHQVVEGQSQSGRTRSWPTSSNTRERKESASGYGATATRSATRSTTRAVRADSEGRRGRSEGGSLDHEAKEVIDLYQAVLRDPAQHRLMINFHGANRPAGESKTSPNEMAREGIYGLEHRKVVTSGEFDTTFPFVRMLAGHADYTPVVFGERRKEQLGAPDRSAAILDFSATRVSRPPGVSAREPGGRDDQVDSQRLG